MDIEKNKQIVLDFIQAMGRGDTKAIVAAYHPEATCWTTGTTLISGVRGVAELEKFSGTILQAFPDTLDFEITGITAEGNRVAVEAESDGDHISGKHYHNFYHFLFELKDDKIYKLKEYMDTEMVTDVLCGGKRRE